MTASNASHCFLQLSANYPMGELKLYTRQTMFDIGLWSQLVATKEIYGDENWVNSAIKCNFLLLTLDCSAGLRIILLSETMCGTRESYQGEFFRNDIFEKIKLN